MCRRFRNAAILLAMSLVILLNSVCATAARVQQSGPATQTGSSHQQPSATQPSDPQGRLRVTTRLVQFNVVVNDKHGNPIIGLTKDDFELLDNKKRQEIRVFAEEKGLSSGASPAPLPADTLRQPDRPAGTPWERDRNTP